MSTPTPPQISPDGRFYWDKDRWVPLVAQVRMVPPPPRRGTVKNTLLALVVAIGSFAGWFVIWFVIFALIQVQMTTRDAAGLPNPLTLDQRLTLEYWAGVVSVVGIGAALLVGVIFWWHGSRPKIESDSNAT